MEGVIMDEGQVKGFVSIANAAGGLRVFGGGAGGAGDALPVQLSGSSAAEDTQTEADATGDVLTFSAPITAIEIYHSEATAQDFIVNGLTLTIAAGGWRSPVGGTPAATVTLPTGVTGILVTRLE